MVERTGFQCTWKIENFLLCPKSGKGLRSPSFVPEPLDQSSWRFAVLPRSGENRRFVGLFLYRHVGIVHLVTLDFEFELQLCDGTSLMKMKHPKKVFRSGSIHGMSEFVPREDVMSKMKNSSKTLTLVCRMWKGEEKPLEFINCSVFSTVGTYSRCFDWRIRNFSGLRPNDKEFCPAKCKLNLPLNVMLYYVDVYRDDKKIHVLGEKNAMPNAASCEISVIANGEPIPMLSECFHMFEDDISSPWIIPRFVNRSELFQDSALYLPNDVLTLRFKFMVSNGTVGHNVNYDHISTSCISHSKTQTTAPSLFLQQDLLQLFVNPVFSDIKLKTNSGEAYQCHKNILSSRSSVFHELMDRHDNGATIDMSQVDSDTLRRMLLFVYTDKIEKLTPENAFKLYVAASVYNVRGLKEECSKFLAKNLRLENVKDVLVLAHSNLDSELKSSSRDFILKHEKEIIKSENWREIYKIDLELAAETLEWLCLQNGKK